MKGHCRSLEKDSLEFGAVKLKRGWRNCCCCCCWSCCRLGSGRVNIKVSVCVCVEESKSISGAVIFRHCSRQSIAVHLSVCLSLSGAAVISCCCWHIPVPDGPRQSSSKCINSDGKPRPDFSSDQYQHHHHHRLFDRNCSSKARKTYTGKEDNRWTGTVKRTKKQSGRQPHRACT